MDEDELYIDIETFSEYDIRSRGMSVYRYVESAVFDILMIGYAFGDEPVQVLEDPEDFWQIMDHVLHAKRVKVAHNAGFERVCFSRYTGLPTGQYLPPEEWVDTQALAAEYGHPQSLSAAAKSLGVAAKDSAGTALINFFCKPNRKGERNLPEHYPEKWDAFVEYCRQDVVVLRELRRALPTNFPTPSERAAWDADQRINDRGIRMDVPMARRAVEAADRNRVAHIQEMKDITGLQNPNSVQQLLPWLQSQGLGRSVKNLRKETVDRALSGLENARTTRSAELRRVLELRRETALTASAKFTAALAGVSEDGRLRGQFRFFGAHTGRWSGRGVQLHNLPRLSLDSEEDAREHAPGPGPRTRAVLERLELGCGASPSELKAAVRPLFVLDGAVVDYAAIEARVIAWLAGEEWALQAFRDGRDIYVETAQRMGSGFTRSQGKIAVLALGYNGGVNSLRAMGYGKDMTDGEVRPLVSTWRKANPAIVRFWAEMGHAFNYGGTAGRIQVKASGRSRYVYLPSGRAIAYHGVIVDEVFHVFDEELGRRVRKVATRFDDPRKPGTRMHTYGGRMSENVTQAVARDLLAHALVELERGGHRPVGHIHDEVLVEGTDNVALISEVMCAAPSWARGLPVGGAGFATIRYRKD